MNKGCAACADVDPMSLLYRKQLCIAPDTADMAAGYSAAQTISYLFIDNIKGPETLVANVPQLVGIL
ncbi:MAG: hypothetical protein QXN23_04025 [Candidatus Caldarchaeum sp.]|nr:hypothetical protein [Candidatus Caldarchaeales archaeon]MDJ0272496.1 hypothetical protein [Candidatus Caldarchaeales archaeon]